MGAAFSTARDTAAAMVQAVSTKEGRQEHSVRVRGMPRGARRHAARSARSARISP